MTDKVKKIKEIENRMKTIEAMVVNKNPERFFDNVMFLVEGLKHQSNRIGEMADQMRGMTMEFGMVRKYMQDKDIMKDFEVWRKNLEEEEKKKVEQKKNPEKLDEKLEEQKKKLKELEKNEN